MRTIRMAGLLFLCATSACTPGGPALVSVSGTITLDGQPLAGATVRFVPLDDTAGHGGTGRTDPQGIYEVVANRQNERKGLLPGKYRVAISTLAPGAKPIETNERESVPDPYHSIRESPLEAVVDVSPKTFDFALKKK